MRNLPYRAVTASGEKWDFEFALHPETADPVRVNQLVTALLHAIDKDMKLGGVTSNGDVMQAVAMVLAIRSKMIATDDKTVRQIVLSLAETAMASAAAATVTSGPIGHA